MRKRDLEKLKKMLLLERQKIIQHLASVEDTSNNEIANTKGDDADIASIQISQIALSRIGEREKRLLSKIDYALAKFDEGTYGICELTGENIPLARLMARPVARYTVEAQEEIERSERRYRDEHDTSDDSSYDSSNDER